MTIHSDSYIQLESLRNENARLKRDLSLKSQQIASVRDESSQWKSLFINAQSELENISNLLDSSILSSGDKITQEIDVLQKAKQTAALKAEALESELAKTQSKSMKLFLENNMLQTRSQHLEHSNRTLGEKLIEVQQKVDNLQHELEEAEKLYQNSQMSHQSDGKLLSDFRKRNELLQLKVSDLSGRLETLENDLSLEKRKCALIETERLKLRDELSSSQCHFQKIIRDHRAKHSELTDSLSIRDAKLKECQLIIQQYKRKTEELTTMITSLTEQKKSLQMHWETRWKKIADRKMTDMGVQVNSYRWEEDKLKKELGQVHQELSELKRQNLLAEDELIKMQMIQIEKDRLNNIKLGGSLPKTEKDTSQIQSSKRRSATDFRDISPAACDRSNIHDIIDVRIQDFIRNIDQIKNI
ncbi:hypothetical protein BKA69DRAFT_1127468 [Paraphysoderma sedebokerense]|nr:hypothetical protein BKA69DRAFT_1127468 [Paraphysoderma sedebokerense]